MDGATYGAESSDWVPQQRGHRKDALTRTDLSLEANSAGPIVLLENLVSIRVVLLELCCCRNCHSGLLTLR
ncbi:hypothetical protein PAHAL_9G376700 [Panicum hallii]|uniref:Uncharacterized protein n=1 Tax=Panicum hallii TaxID=206008 RepID=A0A2S3INF6_9POAL|nr:hypothetical protein PAHAL_9G376700 [Panicum hallii]